MTTQQELLNTLNQDLSSLKYNGFPDKLLKLKFTIADLHALLFIYKLINDNVKPVTFIQDNIYTYLKSVNCNVTLKDGIYILNY